MAKSMYSNGATTLALLVLSAIMHADGFVVRPSVSSGTNTELHVLPKIIKKGEKVETDVDAGGLVQAVVRTEFEADWNLLIQAMLTGIPFCTTYIFLYCRVSSEPVPLPWESLSQVLRTAAFHL